MIPLSIFLVAWLVLIGIYLLLALVSIVQMVRFGIIGPWTYLTTAVYLIVTAAVLGSTALYFMTVDWSLGLQFGSFTDSPLINF